MLRKMLLERYEKARQREQHEPFLSGIFPLPSKIPLDSTSCAGDEFFNEQLARGSLLRRRRLAHGVSNFPVTSGMLAKELSSREKRHFANHSLLSTPSGRIILLYVDELITVSSI